MCTTCHAFILAEVKAGEENRWRGKGKGVRGQRIGVLGKDLEFK